MKVLHLLRLHWTATAEAFSTFFTIIEVFA